MKFIIFGLVLLTLIVSGCIILQGEQNVTNESVTPPTPPPPPVKDPSFTITNPLAGDVVSITDDNMDVTLAMSTQNLVLKQPGGAVKKGEGHFEVTLDDSSPEVVSIKNYLIVGLDVGEHTVTVQLVNNDNTPYSPSIKRSVSFTVEKENNEYTPQKYTVSINDFSYSPAEITLKVGDSIEFKNVGAYPRSATSFVNGKEAFNTQVIGSGKTSTIKFDKLGTYEYYSVTQVSMKGTVVVETNGTQDGDQ